MMGSALKIYPGQEAVFDNVDDAIEFLKSTNFRQEVTLYDIDSKKAYAKARAMYPVIREYNKGKPLNEQILPSTCFAYRGILGCLGVQCYSITMGTYEDHHQSIMLFGNWVSDVLDTTDEVPRISPGSKALSSLAMLGYLARGK